MIRTAWITILAATLWIACGKDVEPPADLTNQWKLQEIQGEPIDSTLLMRSPYITINEEKKSINGFGGCSRMITNFELGEENRMRVEKVKTTKDRCPHYKDEVRWFKLLEKTDAYRIEGNTLYLLDGEREVLTLLTRRANTG